MLGSRRMCCVKGNNFFIWHLLCLLIIKAIIYEKIKKFSDSGVEGWQKDQYFNTQNNMYLFENGHGDWI